MRSNMTDRVVVVTGNGLGRAHALAFAAADVDEITAGGRAVPNTDDISSWDGALINQAVDTSTRWMSW